MQNWEWLLSLSLNQLSLWIYSHSQDSLLAHSADQIFQWYINAEWLQSHSVNQMCQWIYSYNQYLRFIESVVSNFFRHNSDLLLYHLLNQMSQWSFENVLSFSINQQSLQSWQRFAPIKFIESNGSVNLIVITKIHPSLTHLLNHLSQ